MAVRRTLVNLNREGALLKKLVVFLVILAMLLASCGGRAVVTTDGATSQNSLFVYAENAQVLTLDPALAIDDEPLILANCYETLARYNQATGLVEPLLATSWRAEQDGLRWVFQLRRDVRFHDGEAFNASAAKSSIERAMQFDSPYHMLGNYIRKIEATGEFELTFTMDYLVPLDYYLSSLYNVYIVSPNALGADAARTAWFDAGGCAGTGPYTIASYEKGESARLALFADYWQPADPNGFSEIIVSTDEAALAEWLAQPGAAAVAAGSPNAQRTVFETAGAEFGSDLFAYARSHFIMLNTERYPCSNADFRAALCYAFPYSEAEAECGPLARQNGLLAPGLPGADSMLQHFETDLALAQELKVRSGVPAGVEIELVYSTSQMPQQPAYVELFRQNLAEIGVELVVSPGEHSLAELADRDPETASQLTLVSYFAGAPTPRNVFESLAYCDGETLSCHYMQNDELNALIEQAAVAATLDTPESLELYREIQQQLDDNALFIYAGAEQAEYIYTNNIEGLAPQAMSYNGLAFCAFELRLSAPKSGE